MTALLTILLALSLVAIFVFVSRWFRSRSRPFRLAMLAVIAAAAGAALTVEFFIYLHERWIAFQRATEGVPWWVVVAFFLVVAFVAFAALRAVMALDREAIARFFRENINPHVRDMYRDVRSSISRAPRFWPWRRKNREAETAAPPESED